MSTVRTGSARSGRSDPTPGRVERPEGQEVVTRTVRSGLRRAGLWIGIGFVVLLLILGGALLTGSTSGSTPLSPTDPSPAGSQALARVLAEQGVDVVPTESLDETTGAVEDADGDATVIVVDDGLFLDEDQWSELGELDTDLVLVTPEFTALGELAPGVDARDYPTGSLDADCDVPAVERAGEVTVDGQSYSVSDDADAEACLGSDDDGYGLIRLDDGGRTITVLGAREALSNGTIGSLGNAALGLNLLGADETLVWYLPGVDDLPASETLTADQLLPDWYPALVVLALLILAAAATWRGRRLGPLIVENLPVVVPAAETMEGRARLYARSATRRHALDALRIGALSRVARSCGLPRTATVPQIIDAVAAVTGRHPQELAALLVDAEPASDAALVRMSDALTALERQVAEATLGR